MLPIPEDVKKENNRLRDLAAQHIASLLEEEPQAENALVDQINAACENLNIYIKSTALKLLREGKLVGLVGGDHSTPLGLMRALTERYTKFAVLQIDAHADLRKAYEGFTYSHASIMYNALKLPAISKL
jgi:agmatinase